MRERIRIKTNRRSVLEHRSTRPRSCIDYPSRHSACAAAAAFLYSLVRRHDPDLPPSTGALLLTCSRALLGPCVVAAAYLRPDPALLVACVVIAFLTDIFDGVVARRLDIDTANLRRLDSMADSIFYLCALWAVWVLHPQVILENAALLIALAILEGTRYALDLWKFGREASYHMWSSKLWGIALFLAFVAVFVSEDPSFFPVLAIAIGVIADVEGVLISLTLRSWRHDVPSIFHAWRIRDDQHAV